MTELLVGVVAELDERTYGRLGVKESDVETFGAAAGSLVDEAAAFAFDLGESVSDAVGDAESHVLDATATAIVGDELGDSAVLGGTLEELNLGLTYLEESSLNFLVSDFFDSCTLETENVLVERDSLFERGHGDADVFDMGDFHSKKFIKVVLMLIL